MGSEYNTVFQYLSENFLKPNVNNSSSQFTILKEQTHNSATEIYKGKKLNLKEIIQFFGIKITQQFIEKDFITQVISNVFPEYKLKETKFSQAPSYVSKITSSNEYFLETDKKGIYLNFKLLDGDIMDANLTDDANQFTGSGKITVAKYDK